MASYSRVLTVNLNMDLPQGITVFLCCKIDMFINSAVLERVYQPSCIYSFIHHLMAVCNHQSMIHSRHNAQNIFRIFAYTVKNNIYLVSRNRYAIPPEHGKRLERLATGKKNGSFIFSLYSLSKWRREK